MTGGMSPVTSQPPSSLTHHNSASSHSYLTSEAIALQTTIRRHHREQDSTIRQLMYNDTPCQCTTRLRREIRQRAGAVTGGTLFLCTYTCVVVYVPHSGLQVRHCFAGRESTISRPICWWKVACVFSSTSRARTAQSVECEVELSGSGESPPCAYVLPTNVVIEIMNLK